MLQYRAECFFSSTLLLGLNATATPGEIKKAYFKSSIKWHPDKMGQNPSEEDKGMFSKIARAYETLSDERRREAGPYT